MDDDLALITAPSVSAGDLAWQQLDDKIRNSLGDDGWSIKLLDVTGGLNNVIRTSAVDGRELSSEWVSFNTQFSTAPAAIPEADTWAGALIALGVMAVCRRRRSTDTLPERSV